MDIYLAPLEGVTGHVFREAYDLFYGDLDKYFTPFISANDHLNYKTIRELGLISNENGYEALKLHAPLVPQILGNDADKVLATMSEILDISSNAETPYREFNLNFGCPSGTVTAKGRGSGILKDLIKMDDFLDRVFKGSEDLGVKISLKTRIGWSDEKDWPEIVRIYADYPFEEIIIHPRVRADQYNGEPRKAAFTYALSHLNVPLCYNGDIKTREDYLELCKLLPPFGKIMLGRGIVRNPELAEDIRKSSQKSDATVDDKSRDIGKLRDFVEVLEKGYLEEMSCEEHAVMRLKEFWLYFGDSFEGYDKEKREIKKAKSLREYKTITRKICW